MKANERQPHILRMARAQGRAHVAGAAHRSRIASQTERHDMVFLALTATRSAMSDTESAPWVWP
jgi:DeoR/GlpR family transcriptional regulator of sugar metabolism